jgi:adenine-specific DNA-methyltransferase
MANSQILELTWYGKSEEIRIEPRILLNNKQLDYGLEQSDNLLIHGDNLLALKALEQDYTNRVKCIYIDPPYNTGNAFQHYDDGIEHSIWLNLMRERLVILRKLLKNDGFIAIQIDDNEQAYLKILCDEIFGRSSFINSIAVKMSESSGVKMAHARKRFPKLKEYILIYAKSEGTELSNVITYRENSWDKENNIILLNLSPDERKELRNLEEKDINSEEDVFYANKILSKVRVQTLSSFILEKNVNVDENYLFNNAYRIIKTAGATGLFKLVQTFENIPEQDISAGLSKKGILFFYITKFNKNAKQPRLQVIFADSNINKNPGDFWQDIKTTGAIANEGGVSLPNGKKPEKLIMRVIQSLSQPGDIVLDSFLGSGTTAAVAHKLGRRWIGIEIGDQAYSHCVPRLKNVINAEQTGISKEVNWKGGGGYRFYELAPTLIKKDTFGQHVINPEYNPEMLAAAVAKHEGYVFSPHENIYWKQSKTNENSYLFVTTRHMSRELMESISQSMSEGEFLLVVCRSFDATVEKSFKKISLKKIPQSLLRNCEFDVENYNLNIVNPPMYQEDVMEDDLFTEGGDDIE